MRQIGTAELEDIAAGAAVLGTGGGGDPYVGRLIAAEAINRKAPVSVVDPGEVPRDALVVPVAVMGAPTVIVEKIPSGDEFTAALTALERSLGARVDYIACLEAGGINSMVPMAAAAETGLPVIDADGMGRAFPEIHMVLATLQGIAATPMAMADDKGNGTALTTVDNATAERLARVVTVEMGCAAFIALFPMRGSQVLDAMVPGTLSLAEDIGADIRVARGQHRDPVKAACAAIGGFQLFTGKIVDIERTTTGGFARGEARLEGLDGDSGSTLRLLFQNEHLVAVRDGEVVAGVPDLICVLDSDTGAPVTTEAMRYGFRVSVLGAPCDPRWRSPAGLELVGPRYFGYEHAFVPVEELASRDNGRPDTRKAG
ncbi:DUF917 domain-containing protein (plasmid) [Streptomycetaceae bacterium NBC_01309]